MVSEGIIPMPVIQGRFNKVYELHSAMLSVILSDFQGLWRLDSYIRYFNHIKTQQIHCMKNHEFFPEYKVETRFVELSDSDTGSFAEPSPD